MFRAARRLVNILLPAILIVSCSRCNQSQITKPVLVDKPAKVNDEVTRLLRSRLTVVDTAADVLVIGGDSLFATKFILPAYSSKQFAPLWTDKGNLTSPADTLVDILKNAVSYGLLPQDYHYELISQLLTTRIDSVTGKYDAEKVAETELLLTDAFFKFTVHAATGRFNTDSLTLEWHPQKLDTNLVSLLEYAITSNKVRETIDSLEPRNSQYILLKRSLRSFLYEFKDESWDSLASRESDSATFKARLKARLIASHDFVPDSTKSDSMQLVKAIRNFQCRHFLTEDGKIGKLTFRALQRSKQDYINQISLNMERWRWRKEPHDKQFVWVNIPKYEMRVKEADTLVMKSRVIVGQPDHQTPQLKSTIRYFIIYPYWTVPFSIATKELLPILKRDTSYIRKKNFDVLDRNNQLVDPSLINWKRYTKTYFPWKLRQRIGDENSLGILKFNFENKFGVYMHDTDNHRLFGKEMRSLSHGCVRLEKFYDFAKFLIRDDSIRYPVDSLNADLVREQQKYVYIRHPLPVYLTYFTAEVDENGSLYFFIDSYGKDEKMMRALYHIKEPVEISAK